MGGAASRSPHDSHILPTAHKSVMGLFRFSNVHEYPFGSYQGEELILCQEKKKCRLNAEIARKYLNLLGEFWMCLIAANNEFSESAEMSPFEPLGLRYF